MSSNMDATKIMAIVSHIGAGGLLGYSACYVSDHMAVMSASEIGLISALCVTLAGYAGYKSYQGQGTTPSKPGSA